MKRVWNISGEMGKHLPIIIMGKELLPGKFIDIPTALWKRLSSIPFLRDTPPELVRVTPPKPKVIEPPVAEVSLKDLKKSELVDRLKSWGVTFSASAKKAKLYQLAREELNVRE
jgi:hypothetical protein